MKPDTFIWRKPISSFATYCLWGAIGAVLSDRFGVRLLSIEHAAVLFLVVSMAALCIRVRDLHDVFVKKEKA